MRTRLLWLLVVLTALAGPAFGQTKTNTRSLSVGPTPTEPSGTTVRLDGLGTVGGTLVLLTNLDGDVFERVLGKSDLPGSLAYEDEANVFTLGQTFSSTIGVTGLATLTGGFSAGAASSVTGTFGVSGLSTFAKLKTTGIYAVSAPLLFRNAADSATVMSMADTGLTIVSGGSPTPLTVSYVSRAWGGQAASSTTATTTAQTHTAGNTLIALVTFSTTGGSLTSVTSSGSEAYTFKVGYTSSNTSNRHEIWCATSTGETNETTTANFSSGTIYAHISVLEFENGSCTLDGSNTGQAASGTALATGTITATAHSFIVASTVSGLGNAITAGSGFTAYSDTITGAAAPYFGGEYDTSVAASQTAAATHASGSWSILGASFTGAYSGGGGGLLTVDGLSTLTSGFAAGASSTITGSLTLTGDVAVNGGDVTSTAATLNLNAATTINAVDDMTFAGTAGTADYASATTGWRITEPGAADLRYLYVDELHAKAFIADLEMALNGGQVIAKSTVILASDFTCPAAGGTASLVVNDFPGFPNIRAFAANDWVSLRSFSRTDGDNDGNTELTIGDCVGQVSSYTDGSGTQTWTFTRGSGGSAGAMSTSTVVSADAVVIDYGVSGQGFLVARANDGAEGANSPYWQVVTWTTAPVAANMTAQTRWGNLNGSYGYASPIYGFAAGNMTQSAVTVEPTNGFRLLEAGVRRMQLTGSTLRFFDTSGTNYPVEINATAATATLGYRHLGGSYPNVHMDGGAGTLVLANGTTKRIEMAASNGNITVYDDDGSTARVQIGPSTANFGSTAAARVQLDYGGATSIFDASNQRVFYVDGANVIMGNIYDSAFNVIADREYVHIQPTGMSFCNTTLYGCPFTVADGGITMANSISMGGSITMGGDMTLSGGGDITSTGNFSITDTTGLTFADTPTYASARSVNWGTPAGNGAAVHGGVSGSNAMFNIRVKGSGLASAAGLGLTATASTSTSTLQITGTGIGHIVELVASNATTKYLGTAALPWTNVYGSSFHANGTTGQTANIYIYSYNGASQFLCQMNFNAGLMIAHNCGLVP